MEVIAFLGAIVLIGFLLSRESSSVVRRHEKSNPVNRPGEKDIRLANPPARPDDNKDTDWRPISNGVAHNDPPPFPLSMILEGPAYVIDGDTIRIKKIKIRLAGIDAPELDRPWGQKAKWEMVKICKGHTIRVELTGDTSYDRLVGICYLPDGTDIGAEIVKAGLALDGGYYSKGKYRHLEPAGVRRKIRPFGNQGSPRS